MKTRKVITKKDISIRSKLDEMNGDLISEEIYLQAHKEMNLQKIENKVWAMLGDSNLPYSDLSFFGSGSGNYKQELFACSLLYLQAIATVLNKPMPKDVKKIA